MFSRRLTMSIVAGAAAIAVAGCSSGSGSATSSSASPRCQQQLSGGGGSNARSGPAAGGSSGTVSSVSTSGFTITTSAGQKVTVKEASSTHTRRGRARPRRVPLQQANPSWYSGRSTHDHHGHPGHRATGWQRRICGFLAAGVVPFQQDAPATSKTVGQIPADYTQGSGTLASGTTANKATAAALAAYPGGIVDRVVELSNGEYEVHYIGVNWPHHIFVNQDFKVIGANA